MKNRKCNPSSPFRIRVSPVLIVMLVFVKKNEDETFIDYCLVCSSRINDDNDEILQISNM